MKETYKSWRCSVCLTSPYYLTAFSSPSLKFGCWWVCQPWILVQVSRSLLGICLNCQLSGFQASFYFEWKLQSSKSALIAFQLIIGKALVGHSGTFVQLKMIMSLAPNAKIYSSFFPLWWGCRISFNFVKYKVNICLWIVFEKSHRVGFLSRGKRMSPALLFLSVIKFVWFKFTHSEIYLPEVVLLCTSGTDFLKYRWPFQQNGTFWTKIKS